MKPIEKKTQKKDRQSGQIGALEQKRFDTVKEFYDALQTPVTISRWIEKLARSVTVRLGARAWSSANEIVDARRGHSEITAGGYQSSASDAATCSKRRR